MISWLARFVLCESLNCYLVVCHDMLCMYANNNNNTNDDQKGVLREMYLCVYVGAMCLMCVRRTEQPKSSI